MQLTPTQTKAVAASGNVVVIAGAGTGKTRTLVERCLECLLGSASPVDLSEILVVTFTEAAAAEMRQRLRERLQERSDSSRDNARAAQQLALFETAHIGTLHGFCLELARRHFYLLELDPQFTVMSQEEARLLAHEQLDMLFAEKYSEKSPQAAAVRELIASHGDGSEQAIRALVLRLHEYGQTLPDPEGWMVAQAKRFAEHEPDEWNEWLLKALRDFRNDWLPGVKRLAATNGLAEECVGLIEASARNSNIQHPTSGEAPASEFQNETASSLPTEERGKSGMTEFHSSVRKALCGIVGTREKCPSRKKTAWLKPLADFYRDAQFLLSLLPGEDEREPLAEDWSWVRPRMGTLLGLVSEFTARFSRAKRDLALADFHDLEQFALRLLWDNKANAPTKIAEQWREKFRHVMVDEYQDINAAQDQILRALSRDEGNGNRFLVGDLKQSIYRFRLAAPRIFQSYVREWKDRVGTVIPLNENFRSRERILDFINSTFELLMVEDVGGISYGEDARLKFGAPEERHLLAAGENEPQVEFHLRLKRGAKSKDHGEAPLNGEESLTDLEEAAREARLVARRLSELRASRHQIWDDHLKAFRPVEWKDMAILLRSPSTKTKFYVREFARLNVPLAAARGGFYESTEISDMLSLLQILDNPLQDLPVLAVLRSPIVGLSLEELAAIRLAGEGPLWTALVRWEERARARPEATEPTRITRFLERFARWRSLTRQMSLSACLEEILAETHYAEWLLTQPRGEEQSANLQGLVNLTRKFDHFQRQGLLRFLLFIEAQRSAESEPPVPSVIDENAVRLMSIHQSKGLEFPVVALADTGKSFNLSDLKAEIILDDVYGICPLVKPPETAKRYPSLPYWLARRRQRNEMLGEELRLLYVAMTRARDTLILTSSIFESRWNKLWAGSAEAPFNPIASATSVADWLGFWFSRHASIPLVERASLNPRESFAGEVKINGHSLARWALHDDALLAAPPLSDESESPPAPPAFLSDPTQAQAIQKKLAWTYPFLTAVRQTAKSSVSLLRREAALEGEETAQHFDFRPPASRIRTGKAMDAGTATHTFLQRITLDRAGSATELRAEAARLVREKSLSAESAALINIEQVTRFWQSPLGKKVRGQAGYVQRELAFTAKIHLKELPSILGTENTGNEVDDFVIVQGIADVVLLLPQSIEIIDFKTDSVSGKALSERAKQYEPQLKLYATALARIYKRPVSGCWIYFLAAGEEVRVEQ